MTLSSRMKIKLAYSFGIIVRHSIPPACCSNKQTKLAQIQGFWLVGWLVTMALGASLLALPSGPILVRFFRIIGQNLAQKMDNLGEQISTNAHNHHCCCDVGDSESDHVFDLPGDGLQGDPIGEGLPLLGLLPSHLEVLSDRCAR